MELIKLHDNVYYYKKVFENPQSIIDAIEILEQDEATHTAITPWAEDSCDRFRKDLFYTKSFSLQSEKQPLAQKVIEDLKNGIEKIAGIFAKDSNLGYFPNLSPSLDICKYIPGGSLGMHYDGIDGDTSLLYTIVAYFNDDYEGGEISFAILDDDRPRPNMDLNDPNIDFWVKPEAGSVLIFPSQWPYFHQAHEVISGLKYMSTSTIFVQGYDVSNPEHREKYRIKKGDQ